MVPKEAAHDADEWPEMRAAGHSGGKDKVSWGEDVRSEEENYLAKLGKWITRIGKREVNSTDSASRRE